MSVLPILTIPDPILRAKAAPVERVDDAVRQLLDDMLETMYAAPGVGLAAPQVGVSRRLIVLDPAKDGAPENPIFMINPEILSFGEEMRVHEEGCLSIPEIFAEIERSAECRVRFLDRAGKSQEMLCNGLIARIVQHEVDHLDGVLFIDYLSRLKRGRLVKKFLKAKRESEEAI